MRDAYICSTISHTIANTSILTVIVLIIRELHMGDLWKSATFLSTIILVFKSVLQFYRYGSG